MPCPVLGASEQYNLCFKSKSVLLDRSPARKTCVSTLVRVNLTSKFQWLSIVKVLFFTPWKSKKGVCDQGSSSPRNPGNLYLTAITHEHGAAYGGGFYGPALKVAYFHFIHMPLARSQWCGHPCGEGWEMWSTMPCSSVGKQSACSAGDPGLIPGLGRSPGERKGYPLQYSCGECHGQRSVAGYSPWDCRVGRDCEINFHFHC